MKHYYKYLVLAVLIGSGACVFHRAGVKSGRQAAWSEAWDLANPAMAVAKQDLEAAGFREAEVKHRLELAEAERAALALDLGKERSNAIQLTARLAGSTRWIPAAVVPTEPPPSQPDRPESVAFEVPVAGPACELTDLALRAACRAERVTVAGRDLWRLSGQASARGLLGGRPWQVDGGWEPAGDEVVMQVVAPDQPSPWVRSWWAGAVVGTDGAYGGSVGVTVQRRKWGVGADLLGLYRPGDYYSPGTTDAAVVLRVGRRW